MGELSKQHCPLCLRETVVHPVEEYGQFHILKCSVCHLIFCDPLVYSEQSYDQGYAEADSDLSRMGDYAEHVRYAEWLAGVTDLRPYLLPLERIALHRLAKVVPAASAVLDLGCGAGRFLLALRQQGYNALGLEVAEAPVKILQRRSIPVRQGTLADFSPEWPEPSAVVCFEVLEHLADPVGFLQDIARDFPQAQLLLAVPYAASRRRFDAKFRQADYPPNHLTRWNKRSMSTLLEKTGYTGLVEVVHVTGDQIPFSYSLLSWLKRKLTRSSKIDDKNAENSGNLVMSANRYSLRDGTKTTDVGMAFIKIAAKRILFSPYIAAMRLFGGSGYWLLATVRRKDR